MAFSNTYSEFKSQYELKKTGLLPMTLNSKTMLLSTKSKLLATREACPLPELSLLSQVDLCTTTHMASPYPIT